MILTFIITLIIGLLVIKSLVDFITGISKKDKKGILTLFSISYFLVILLGFWAWSIKKSINKSATISYFLNNTKHPVFSLKFLKDVIIGISYGFVFGFIDNFGLWFGIDLLEPIMPGGNLTKAALGNTYSNVLGALVATFLQKIIKFKLSTNENNVEKTPLWCNTLGTGLGCLTAIVICTYIFNYRKKLINKI